MSATNGTNGVGAGGEPKKPIGTPAWRRSLDEIAAPHRGESDSIESLLDINGLGVAGRTAAPTLNGADPVEVVEAIAATKPPKPARRARRSKPGPKGAGRAAAPTLAGADPVQVVEAIAAAKPGKKPARGQRRAKSAEPAKAGKAPKAKTPTVKEIKAGVPPAWGWREPLQGRVSHVGVGPEYQATTTQACGLFPFLAGSGSPAIGVPIGRHLLWGEVVCIDQFGWLTSGLVTNPGIFLLGEPGIGKSAFIKRLARGMCGYGVRPFILGDLKPDYTRVIERLGGQVVRIGRGLDRINPLDSGPMGEAVARLSGKAADELRAEIRGRRLNALIALLTLVRRGPIRNGEENVLGAIVDLLDRRSTDRRRRGADQPTIPDVLTVLRDEAAIKALMPVADVQTDVEFRADTKELFHTCNLLCAGSLKGVFDGPTSTPIDLDAPAVSVDISRVSAAGDTLVAAAMLSTWAYGFALIDGAAALADAGVAPRRQYLVVMDELWRALRGSPGLVELADALTRVNRAKGVADVRATHSLADLEALPTEEDRKKARGFVERAGVVILGGLPGRELEEVNRVVKLSWQERMMVSGWSAPESWVPNSKHPGRGKYLIKCGRRTGIPVEMDYVGDEQQLYDTDAKMALLDHDEMVGVE